jgi:hypothetical protein
MEEQIRQAIRNIEYFLKNPKDGLFLPILPICFYDKIFDKLGFNDERNWEANGFEVDFRYYVTHPEYKSFVFSGSLWRGNYSISIDDN